MEYPKMSAYWKDWWLRALRGGNYKQCQRMLRNQNNECCCFGVLADGVASNTWRSRWGAIGWTVGKEEAVLRLPPSLQTVTQVSTDALVFLERHNDAGWTFADIADWIEQNL